MTPCRMSASRSSDVEPLVRTGLRRVHRDGDPAEPEPLVDRDLRADEAEQRVDPGHAEGHAEHGEHLEPVPRCGCRFRRLSPASPSPPRKCAARGDRGVRRSRASTRVCRPPPDLAAPVGQHRARQRRSGAGRAGCAPASAASRPRSGRARCTSRSTLTNDHRAQSSSAGDPARRVGRRARPGPARRTRNPRAAAVDGAAPTRPPGRARASGPRRSASRGSRRTPKSVSSRGGPSSGTGHGGGVGDRGDGARVGVPHEPDPGVQAVAAARTRG